MTVGATRVGVQIWPQHSSFAEQRRTWLLAEDLGVDDVFTWDHFFPLRPDPKGSDFEGSHFEGWTLLGAMAEVTQRVRIGTLVSSVGYRNPDLLADMARTLDHASAGRAILGIGAGWNQRDYEEYGYDYGTVSDRASHFSRCVPRIVGRLASLRPPPVSEPLPILIGGGGERTTLRLAAEHAHIWNAFFDDAEAFMAKNRVLDRWCAEVGREPDDIVRSIAINNPEQFHQLDDFHEAGIRHVIVGQSVSGFDADLVQRLVDWREHVNR